MGHSSPTRAELQAAGHDRPQRPEQAGVAKCSGRPQGLQDAPQGAQLAKCQLLQRVEGCTRTVAWPVASALTKSVRPFKHSPEHSPSQRRRCWPILDVDACPAVPQSKHAQCAPTLRRLRSAPFRLLSASLSLGAALAAKHLAVHTACSLSSACMSRQLSTASCARRCTSCRGDDSALALLPPPGHAPGGGVVRTTGAAASSTAPSRRARRAV